MGLDNARDAYEASLREGHRYDGMSGLLRVLRSMDGFSILLRLWKVTSLQSLMKLLPWWSNYLCCLESDARSRRNKKRLSSLGGMERLKSS